MKPIDPRFFIGHFPEGSRLAIIQAPPGTEDFIEDAMAIKTSDDCFYFILDFEHPDEKIEFLQEGRLILKMMGHVVPFAVGAFHVPGTGEEENQDHNLELITEQERRKRN